MSLVGYARVSTAEGRQVLDPQLDALDAAACERVFEDHTSGAAADRPNLAACLDYLRRGDLLVVLDLPAWCCQAMILSSEDDPLPTTFVPDRVDPVRFLEQIARLSQERDGPRHAVLACARTASASSC